MRAPTGDAEQKRAMREQARRREAEAMLRLTAAMCEYAAGQLADGLSPGQARAAALEAAGELAVVAEVLRRKVRLGPAERRALAVQLHALGVPRREMGWRLGVSEVSVRHYLRAAGIGPAGPRPGS